MILAIINTAEMLSDEKLIDKYKSTGNSWFVGELYKRYSNPVTAVCYSYFKNREETEDAVMEVFELIMADLKKYEVKVFKPWLLTVVKHYCIRKKEKASREKDNHQELKKNKDHFMELWSELSLEHIDGSEEEVFREGLGQAIEQLKDEQRLCVELFFLKEKSYQDICDETGFPMNKVKSFIQNGKRNLKIYLESLNG